MTRNLTGVSARAVWRAAIAVVVFGIAGCGPTADPPDPEALAGESVESVAPGEPAPQASSPETPPPPQPAATAESDMTGLPGGFQELAATLQSDAAPVASPISAERLMNVLPELPGWTRSRHRGERLQTPAAHTMASARYERDAARIDMEVVDTALDQTLLSPYTMFTTPGFEERTGADVRRAITLRESPGFEAWRAGTRRAEVVMVIHARFVVKGTSHTVSDLESLRQFVARMRLDTLERLK